MTCSHWLGNIHDIERERPSMCDRKFDKHDIHSAWPL